MNCLLLMQTSPDDWALHELKKNFDTFIIFRQIPKILRTFRRLWIKFDLPWQFLWYDKQWKQKIKRENFDLVVVFMSELTADLPRYINILNTKAKVVVWYWNCVHITLPPSKIKGNCEIWSFDFDDCKKYGMKFNHQFYFKRLIAERNSLEYDIYFQGSDAGRGEKIVKLYSLFSNLNLKCLFKIYNPKYEACPIELNSPKISYEKMVENISKCRALLEMARDGQSGPTLRLMEALFNKKKVVTTNKAVVQEPFYNPQNIFILGERPVEELYNFVKSSYVDMGEKFIDLYDVSNWIRNFCR